MNYKTATKYHLRMGEEKTFEDLYLSVRQKEGRLYLDEEVAALPHINSYHLHFAEWQIRKRSADRLFHYLQQKEKPLSILEVGCGNGWLVASLANIKGSSCTGIDVNTIELKQAKRVFEEKKNLSFHKEEIRSQFNADNHYDIIVFAASIQYFPSFDSVMADALNLLKKDGEIHILDSHFYASHTINKAKERTNHYYNSMGCPEMTKYYHHHLRSAIDGFHHKLLFDPNSFINKWFHKNSFPWIVVTSRK